MFCRFFIGILFFCGVPELCAQDTLKNSVFTPNTSEVIDLTPTDDYDEKVSIANLSETKVNEAPGSVYIITAEEMEKNGYKDLLDVFVNIPGFSISTDTQNGTGLALRGLWTGEAKMLWMVDGMIMNEMAYGSFVLGGRIPLLNIERIEIIKGASSSIYGGIAGLGVVNIVTKSGKTSKGSSFRSDFGISNNARSRNRLTFENTSYFVNDFEVSACGSLFTGNRSNQKYTQADSTVTNFNDSSYINDVFLEMKLRRKAFEYKVLYNDYNFQATHEPISTLSRTFINELSFNKTINKLSLNCMASFKDQVPWNTQYGNPQIYDAQNLKTWRLTVSTIANYEVSSKINALVGVQYYRDHMHFYRHALLLNNGSVSSNFNAYGAFTELSFKSKFINVFAGGRYDYYDGFTPNFSPRISLTKDFKFFHYKLMYGQSFKIPTLQNINLSYKSGSLVRPEQIYDYQLEFGLKHHAHGIKTNIFLTTIDNIIVYGYDLTNKVESYVNNGSITTRGVEVLLNSKLGPFTIKTSYSNYGIVSFTSTDYLVDSTRLSLGALSIPRHKVSMNLRYDFTKKYGVVVNYVYQSNKFSNEQVSVTTGKYARVEYKPIHILDVVLRAKMLIKYTDFSIGIHNLLNTSNFYSYPISSGYPAAIGMGREFFMQIKLSL